MQQDSNLNNVEIVNDVNEVSMAVAALFKYITNFFDTKNEVLNCLYID